MTITSSKIKTFSTMSHNTNFALFTIWTDEKFNQVLEKVDDQTFYRGIAFTEKAFETLSFEEKNLSTSERIETLKELFSLDTTSKMRPKLRGWIFDLKKLYWFGVLENEYDALQEMGIKSFDDFGQLEEFCESYKHRFASKKFGL